MTCESIPMKNGVIFMCSRGSRKKPRCKCGSLAVKLCDYPLRGAKSGSTCDRPLCARCASTEPDVVDMAEERALQLGIEDMCTSEGKKLWRGRGLRLEKDTFDLCPAHARLVGGKK